MSAEPQTRKNLPPPSVTGTLPELCDKLLSLIAAYPEACGRGVRRMTADSEGLKRLGIAFGAIGYEYSRQLFPWITDLQWFMMENHAAQATQTESPGVTAIGRSVLAVFTELLAESMGADEESVQDPFSFLNDLDAGRLAITVHGEAAESLALLAAFWGPSDVSRVLRVVPENTRVQAILHIARLQRVPEAEARKSAARFAERLKKKVPTIPARPEIRPAIRAKAPVTVSPVMISPPPPPIPRLSTSGLGESAADVQAEEALLASLRAESPELYRELAHGDYFKANRR